MALLRVKRRLQDDPIDVLLLSCKKPKTEEDSVTKLFKFAATVDEQDGDIRKHITEVKSVNRQSLKYRNQNISALLTEKLRSENKLSSRSNRLKVVNWFRAVGDEGNTIGDDDDETYTVVDLVNPDNSKSSSATSGVIDKTSHEVSSALTEEQYVYDLYYSAVGGDIDDLQMENLLSVQAVNQELLFGDFMEDKDDTEEDDDDSNAENNWRNDYPDERSEEDFSSDDENLMRLAVQMKNVAIDGEYHSDLSSDEGDSLLVYSEQDPDYYYHSESSRSESSLSYYSTD